MKIAIAGAGAMGGRFGYKLVKAGNKDVFFVDRWEANVEAIRSKGLQVDDGGVHESVEIPVYFPEELADNELQADLVILFVKAMQLDDMLKSLKPLLGESTYVLCLLNGIGHESVVERHIPRSRILLGNTMWTAGLEGPGRIKLVGGGSIDLQNLMPEGKDMAIKVAELLTEAGLIAGYSENVLHMIYKKACVNGAVNGICALLDCNINTYGSTACAEAIVRAVVGEFIGVAAAEGVDMVAEDMVQNILKSFAPEAAGLHYPSMHQDLVRNNRLTEIDYINGVIVQKGLKYGISTPYCSLITQLVHCKEEILGAK